MTHSLPYAVNCSLLFTEVPLLQRAAAAREAGFDAVELWWPFAAAVPADAEVDALIASVRDAGASLVGLNFFAGDMPGGDRGLVSWTGRSAEFRDNVDVTVGIGQALGCTAFNALYGNRLEGSDPAEQDELAVENLTLAARAAARIGGRVLLEPVSGAARYPLRTAADVVSVIERVEAADASVDNVRLLFDLYHLAVNGDDVAAAADAHVGRVGHVQVADAPGRGEPGSGELPIDDLLTRLATLGYDGYAALEYKPTTTTLESLSWLPADRRGSRAMAVATAAKENRS